MFFRLSRGVAGGFWMKIEAQLAQPCYMLESWNFGFKTHFSQLGAPHSQKFEILKFLKKLWSQKILKSVLKTFKKCKMAQNLVKDAFWEFLIRKYSDLENSKFSLRKT
jgi:hypothetical protein